MKRSLVLAAFAVLMASTASAHDIHLFVQSVERGIQGRVLYGHDDPVENARVRVSDRDARELGVRVTSRDGLFSFPALEPGVYRLSAETEDGHRAETEYTLTGAASVSVDLPTSAELERAVARGVAPLEERIDRLERRTGLRDILGGIGYIVGIVALLTLLRRHREA